MVPSNTLVVDTKAWYERLADGLARLGLWIVIADVIVSTVAGLIAVVEWQDANSGPGGGWGVPGMALMLAAVLGAPSFLVGLVDLARGRWREAGRLMAVVGPVLIFVGFFFGAHWAARTWSITERYHLLYHALLPTAALVALYVAAFRRWYPSQVDHPTRESAGNALASERLPRLGGVTAILGGIIVVAAAVADWRMGLGSINDPLNPRWREAVALLAPGLVIAALGLALAHARLTQRSRLGLLGSGLILAGIAGFTASWTILHRFVFPLAPLSVVMLLLGAPVLGVALWRAGLTARTAILLLLVSPIGLFIAIGPPQPGVFILLLATYGVSSTWLGYDALRITGVSKTAHLSQELGRQQQEVGILRHDSTQLSTNSR